MGYRSGFALGILAGLGLLLSSALPVATQSTMTLQTSISAVQTAPSTTLPDGPGKQVVARMCTGCHNLQTVTSKRATPADWAQIVDAMVSRGAEGTDEDIAQVTKYLSANFSLAPATTAPPQSSTPQ